VRWILLLLLAGLVSNGCATRKGKAHAATGAERNSTNSKTAIVTPATGTVGRVTFVNAKARFVVISYPVGDMPALERRLNVYRNGLKVAEVKVTGPTHDTHTAGDILAGDCQTGDEVREN
jgi:hypothetical protein